MNQLVPHQKKQLIEVDPDIYAYRDEVIKPYEIRWFHLIKKRLKVLDTTELPNYLLLPEIMILLSHAQKITHHAFFSTLWHTGMRLSEALSLKKESFDFTEGGESVTVTTLKTIRRNLNSTLTASAQPDVKKRKRTRKSPKRNIPLTNPEYLEQIKRFIASAKLRNTDRLFPVNPSTPHRWLKQILGRMLADDHITDQYRVNLSKIDINCKVFRHSFAVNAILHGTHRVLQQWLGHKDVRSTEVYTAILSEDTRFLMERI